MLRLLCTKLAAKPRGCENLKPWLKQESTQQRRIGGKATMRERQRELQGQCNDRHLQMSVCKATSTLFAPFERAPAQPPAQELYCLGSSEPGNVVWQLMFRLCTTTHLVCHTHDLYLIHCTPHVVRVLKTHISMPELGHPFSKSCVVAGGLADRYLEKSRPFCFSF